MSEQAKHEPFPIIIDRKEYKVDQQEMTGAQLRQVPTPPISEDYDLYQEIPGDEDKLIADDETVELKPGMHFHSVEKHITPGG
jgi:Multiubiquitin